MFDRLARQPPLFWFAALAALLMAVGGLGPWATALGVFSISGTNGDGWLVVAAGVVGGGALLAGATWRATAILAVLCGCAGAAVSGIDLHHIATVSGGGSFFGQHVTFVKPAWGIYLSVGASVALAGFALAFLIRGLASTGPGLTAGIAVGVVAAGVAAAAVLAGTGGSTSQGATTQATNAPTIPTVPTAPSSPGSTPAAGQSPPGSGISAGQVQQVLDKYAAAYTAENAHQLLAVFAHALVRRNATDPPQDLKQALATYRTQFSQLQSPTYTLSSVHITPGATDATANANYSITSQNGAVSGTVTFHFVPKGAGLGIDQLTIQPNP